MKTPHLFNEEKRRASLPIGSFAMQSVPDQQPAAGEAEHTPTEILGRIPHKAFFHLVPRYTCGSPAMVDRGEACRKIEAILELI